MLSPEAKRVLLASAITGEVSIPELADITEYPQEEIRRFIQELSSLFLLAGEALGDQPRFSVPDNTIRMVLERATTLVTDHRRLRDRAIQSRSGTGGSRTKDQRVGHAIAQAQAQLKLGDTNGALKTIDDARKTIKNHPDLLGYRAEVLIRLDPPKYDEARRNARDAFQKNCRRPSMYEAWFEAEWNENNFVGAEEVARAAIGNSISGNGTWWVRLAAALASRADSQNVGTTQDKRISTYLEASSALGQAINSTRGGDGKEWEKIRFDIHDRIWQLVRNTLSDLNGIDVAVGALESISSLKDFRFTNANHAISIAESICILLESSVAKISEAGLAASELRFKRLETLLRKRQSIYPDDTRQPALDTALESVTKRFSDAVSDRRSRI